MRMLPILIDCEPGQHVPSEIRQSTRSKPTPPVQATKNVCRECCRLIVFDGGTWVIDETRERELAVRMRM